MIIRLCHNHVFAGFKAVASQFFCGFGKEIRPDPLSQFKKLPENGVELTQSINLSHKSELNTLYLKKQTSVFKLIKPIFKGTVADPKEVNCMPRQILLMG